MRILPGDRTGPSGKVVDAALPARRWALAGHISGATAGLSLVIPHVLPRLAAGFTINPPFVRTT